MRRIFSTIMVFCILLISSCAFGENESGFSILNDVRFGDSMEEVLGKETNASLVNNGEVDRFGSKVNKKFLKEFIEMGNEQAEVYFIFNNEDKLTLIIYRLSNNDFSHQFNLASKGSDPDYKGADNQEQFHYLFEQVEGAISKKYGDPLALKEGEKFPLSTGAGAMVFSGQKTIETSEWLCSYDGYSVKIDLINAGKQESRSSYIGTVIVGYYPFENEAVQEVLNNSTEAQESLSDFF